MTTVTEAAKHLGIDLHPLDEANLAALKEDPALAQQLGRRLLVAARELAPEANWTLEALIEVLENAAHGRIADVDRVVEGRHLRKRVRELCGYAERYQEPFALVVLKLTAEPEEGIYARAARSIVEALRRTDMVTVYRRRLAILLPNMEQRGLVELTGRVSDATNAAVGARVVASSASFAFNPGNANEPQPILDWLEDQLRLDV